MSEIKDNINITLILQLTEVINRIIDCEIDNKTFKMCMKRDFKALSKAARDLDKSYRGFIKTYKKFENPEELFDTDVDDLYTLVVLSAELTNYDDIFELIKQKKHESNIKLQTY